jgi:hypothetical protein
VTARRTAANAGISRPFSSASSSFWSRRRTTGSAAEPEALLPVGPAGAAGEEPIEAAERLPEFRGGGVQPALGHGPERFRFAKRPGGKIGQFGGPGCPRPDRGGQHGAGKDADVSEAE